MKENSCVRGSTTGWTRSSKPYHDSSCPFLLFNLEFNFILITKSKSDWPKQQQKQNETNKSHFTNASSKYLFRLCSVFLYCVGHKMRNMTFLFCSKSKIICYEKIREQIKVLSNHSSSDPVCTYRPHPTCKSAHSYFPMSKSHLFNLIQIIIQVCKMLLYIKMWNEVLLVDISLCCRGNIFSISVRVIASCFVWVLKPTEH